MNREFRIAPGSAVILVIVILTGAWALWLLRDLALLILTAIVIASAIEPGVVFFARHRIPRIASALLMYVLVIGSLFSIIYFFFPPIINDAQQFLGSIPQYLNTLNLPLLSTGESLGLGKDKAHPYLRHC